MKIRRRTIPKEGWIMMVFFVCTASLLINTASSAQNTGVIGDDTIKNQGHIELSKVASSTILITNKSSFVGGFDTTYSITGNIINIKDSEDLIISSMVDDFIKSPAVGYVKISKSMSNSSGVQIANPFATNEQIQQKIQELVQNSIIDVNEAQTDIVSITCHFGNSLDAFSCLSLPLSN
jgi:hypothetical protein